MARRFCDEPGYAVTMNLRRRDLLRLTGAGAATLAIGCGDNQPYRLPDDQHAVAILEPEFDSFLVALWSPVARTAVIEVRSGDELLHMLRIELDAAQHAVMDVTGLPPSTSYQVTVTCDDGVVLGPHQVRTAPAVDDSRAVRIAVSADLDPSPEFDSELLSHLSQASPELYVSIGDMPYTDNGPPAMTVEAYRARHAEVRTAPKHRAWLQAMGVRAIYDDHEFRNNWDAMFVAAEPDRYAAAMQVWDEFFPLRASVVRGGEIRYRSWRWGAHVEGFLLDTRRFRSADAAPDDASKTMLGAVQRAWLEGGLARSTATWKLVFTTVPLDFGTGNDYWGSFATERDAIFDAIAAARVPGLLFVSGDHHFFAAHRHAHGIREFQIGPLARGLGAPGPPAPGVVFRSVQLNFGLVDADADRLTFRGVGADGTAFYEESFSVSDLTPM